MRFFFLLTTPPAEFGAWQPPLELMQHLRALRFGPEEEFLLLAADGGAWRARLKGRAEVELLGSTQAPTVKQHTITLATAWPKGKRAEELVVRACEAGVARIQPVQFQRSVAGRQAWGSKQSERLQRIARESCQQLRNPLLPKIDREPIAFSAWLEQIDAEKYYFLHPGAPALTSIWLPCAQTTMVIGPEGGFTDEEVAAMQSAGMTAAGMGPLILRIAAAGPTAAALIQHAWLAGQETARLG
jgi:16S rRNA (uracil1498-N3)-methyltransferase